MGPTNFQAIINIRIVCKVTCVHTNKRHISLLSTFCTLQIIFKLFKEFYKVNKICQTVSKRSKICLLDFIDIRTRNQFKFICIPNNGLRIPFTPTYRKRYLLFKLFTLKAIYQINFNNDLVYVNKIFFCTLYTITTINDRN